MLPSPASSREVCLEPFAGQPAAVYFNVFLTNSQVLGRNHALRDQALGDSYCSVQGVGLEEKFGVDGVSVPPTQLCTRTLR